MKKLTVYNVYLDDGKSVFRVTVPAASKKEAADYVQGNGETIWKELRGAQTREGLDCPKLR